MNRRAFLAGLILAPIAPRSSESITIGIDGGALDDLSSAAVVRVQRIVQKLTLDGKLLNRNVARIYLAELEKQYPSAAALYHSERSQSA